jgi:hypothetical protein
MNREEESHALRRKASAAGLIAGLLFLLLASVAVLVVIGFWPLLETLPVAESVPEAKPDGLRSLAPPF